MCATTITGVIRAIIVIIIIIIIGGSCGGSGGGGGGGGAGAGAAARRQRGGSAAVEDGGALTAGGTGGTSPPPSSDGGADEDGGDEGTDDGGLSAPPENAYAGLGPGRWGGGGRARRAAATGPRAARAEAGVEAERLVVKGDVDPGTAGKRDSRPRPAHAGPWAAAAAGLGRGFSADGIALAGTPALIAAGDLPPDAYAASVARFAAGLVQGAVRDAVLARAAASLG
jgi:hypothetical protein